MLPAMLPGPQGKRRFLDYVAVLEAVVTDALGEPLPVAKLQQLPAT